MTVMKTIEYHAAFFKLSDATIQAINEEVNKIIKYSISMSNRTLEHETWISKRQGGFGVLRVETIQTAASSSI
jgi:phage terminase small subunit